MIAAGTQLHVGFSKVDITPKSDGSFKVFDPIFFRALHIRRGDTQLIEIDGDGVLSMGGAQPRFYIQPQSGEADGGIARTA